MKKLVILLALMVGLSAATASAVGITIRGPGQVTARVVVRDSSGRMISQIVGGRAVPYVVMDNIPNTIPPALAGIRTRTSLMQVQVFNSAFGGTLVASGTFNQVSTIYIVFNGATWTISQTPPAFP